MEDLPKLTDGIYKEIEEFEDYASQTAHSDGLL